MLISGIEGSSYEERQFRREIRNIFFLQRVIDIWKGISAVSNLDEESKWTVHYKASWHQQENVFLPSSRTPCVEDLHRQAKVNLKTVLRDCDKLRKDGFRSSQYYSQGPIFSSASSHLSGSCLDEEEDLEQMSTASSADEEKLFYSRRSKTPVPGDLSEIDVQTNWTKALPLPTPEERMRQQAQAVQTDVIPINVTGESFDRQAGTRRSLVRSETALRRPTKIKRRKTITGLPDTIQKELGTGQTLVRGHSIVLPGQYSTMSRLESSNNARGRSATKDSSCQTDEVKVVPPSVRRIRAQKGHGIAAQLSSSSGNMSTASDGAGTLRPNGDLRFHSLPRPGARVSLHALDYARCAVGKSEESFGTLPGRVGKLRVDGSAIQPRTGALPRPKSQEMRSRQAATEEIAGPARAVSPRAARSTRLIAHATLSSTAEVVAIRTARGRGGSSPPRCPIPAPLGGTAGQREEHHSSSGNWSGSSGGGGGSARHSPTSDTIPPPSLSDSAVSLTPGPGAELPDLYRAREAGGKVSSAQASRLENGSGRVSEHWASGTPVTNHYPPGARVVTSGCRAPGCHADSGSDLPLPPPPTTEANWSSPYPEAHFAPAEVAAGTRGEGKGRRGLDGRPDYSDRSLGRSISLKKTKKPPPPPARTDSLRKKAKGGRPVLSESLIATLQRTLEVNLKCRDSPPASPVPSPADPWVMRPRSQSSASAGGGSSHSSSRSTAASNAYSTGAATPSQSETSSLRSEYGDPWAYYTDGVGGRAEDEGPRAGAWEYTPDHLPRACAPHAPSSPAKPKSSSPDKSHGVTSPSSGYSSQCNTPTMLNPAPVFLRQVSPGPTKPKPKVPERKSSLLSSVSTSSSSASLSSNASDSRHQGADTRAASSNAPPVLLIVPNLHPPPLPMLPPPAPPLPTSLPAAPSLPTSLPAAPPLAPPLPTPPPPAPPLPTSPPPAPPLHPEALKCSKPPPRSSARGCVEEPKAPADQDQARKPAMGLPLITPQALQMVQLKSIRRNDQAKPPRQVEEPHPRPKLPDKPELPLSPPPHKLAVLQRPLSLRRFPKRQREATTVTAKVPVAPGSDLALGSKNKFGSVNGPEPLALSNAHEEVAKSKLEPTVEPLPYSSTHTAQSNGTDARIDIGQALERALPPEKPNAKSPSKMPPPIARKPKLSLLVPPSPWNLVTQERQGPPIVESAAEATAATTVSVRINGDQPSPQNVDEADSGSSDPVGKSEDTVRHEAWEADQRDAEQLSEESWENPSVQEEQATDSSSTCDSMEENSTITCQDDEMSDVFEASSSTLTNSNGESGEDPSTPSRLRTTEDLFAAIHRSKRRVLGRKDSEDELNRTLSPSPPVTPTGSIPSPGPLRQVGFIQRGLRKSSTSSDSFKALLLKKGTRPETGCRMSAAEMLRSSDPRQRPAELPVSDCRSPGQRGRSPREEWAWHEGPVPRGAGPAGFRHGRSRTPPSAASSRYGGRLHLHRLHSSPMTVICEGEAEASEAVADDGRRRSEGDISSSGGGLEAPAKREPMGTPEPNGLCGHVDSGPAAWKFRDSSRGATELCSAQRGSGTLTPEGANQDWDS
uniref:NHS-like protein 1 isoform X2 n=1 Tax=Pristiophorus japonicus TaxID=55135 RepID=UPI00398E5306